jgi:hypothetical protein
MLQRRTWQTSLVIIESRGHCNCDFSRFVESNPSFEHCPKLIQRLPAGKKA